MSKYPYEQKLEAEINVLENHLSLQNSYTYPKDASVRWEIHE